MILDVDKLKDGCPKKIEEEMKEIIILSRKFVDATRIETNQELEEVKIDIQDAKDYIFQIMSRFFTLISSILEDEMDLKKVGLRLKFEEDIGSVIKDLKEKNAGKIEHLIGITSLLKFSGELKTTYDFLIYHPIIMANKLNTDNQDIPTYIKNLFKTLRANASILGYSGKFSLPISKQILPRPISMIATNKKPEDTGDENSLRDLGEDEEEEEEEGDEDD